MTVSLPDRPSWHAQAECAGVDPDLFHPTNGDYRQAARVCETCPVKAECLQWALDHDEPHGMWGGLHPEQRRRLQLGQPIGRPRQSRPIDHGTERGYRQHYARGEPPCSDCRAARAAFRAAERQELAAVAGVSCPATFPIDQAGRLHHHTTTEHDRRPTTGERTPKATA